MKKIVINIFGGLVQEVYCSDPEFKVIVMDFDQEDGDAENLIAEEDLEREAKGLTQMQF
jgi:hypothetical protein